MKVLLSWLQEFAPFEGDPVELGEVMSDLGMAVEELVEVGGGLDGIVVARVLDLRPHPDADRIQLVDVDLGDGEALQICCGAFNMSAGDLVPLATIGTEMPGGLTIARRKMRGEWSNGMLCSSAELGLGDDHGGILLLDDGEPGTPLREALDLHEDVLYDLEINPNRPDAMSVAGVARDLAARLRLPFAVPIPSPPSGGGAASERASVEIVDADLCGRFLVSVLDGVEVGRSPRWLANRLTAAGMRPINSVVDVSNYVMLELGQPNHTYDLARVPAGALRVRWARDGERIVTLDGVERVLSPSDGVIADRDDSPIGIAGVMGGASTEISAETESVLLEMAWWRPMAVARSSKRLGLRSEASARFERGTDPDVVELAAARFAELMDRVGAAAVVSDVPVDVLGDRPERPRVEVRTERVATLLGVRLSPAQIHRYLEPIGFEVRVAEGSREGTAEAGDAGRGERLEVTVPSFRPDTSSETDVIEEIARHHGYRAIPLRMPHTARSGGLSPRQRDRRLVREVMVGSGLSEAMPTPFLAPGDLDRAGLEPGAVTITNPLVAEESVMRTSLRPGLAKVVAFNGSHRNPGVRLFEIGRVFLPPPPGQVLPTEIEQLGAALAGAEAPEAVALWSALATALAVPDGHLVADAIPGLHPTRSAWVEVGATRVGAVGEIDPAVLAAYGVTDERVAWLELDLDRLLAAPHGETTYRRVSRYPSSDIDLAFVVDEVIPAAELEAVIQAAAGDLLRSIRLFDVYRGAQVGPEQRSLGYTLRLQADDRTLTDDEVAELRTRVIDAVEAGVAATLRA